jgi:hypothetical protein
MHSNLLCDSLSIILLASRITFCLALGWFVFTMAQFSLHAEYPDTGAGFYAKLPDQPKRKAIEGARIKQAADADPFHPERTRSEVSEPAPDSVVRQPVPDFRLLGTVITGADAFAMIEQAGSIPALVRVGDSVGSLRIRKLSAGKAIVAFNDSTFVLALPRIK